MNLLQTLKGRLDERSSTPLYHQLADAIRALIQEGQLRAGDRLDPERKMTEEIGVSRRTVRSALAELIDGKYIEATHGRGNFVLEPPMLKQLRVLVPERFRPEPWVHPVHYDLLHEAEIKANCKVHYEYVPELEGLKRLLLNPPREFDGIVIYRPAQDRTDLLRELASKRAVFPLPTVAVNRDLSGTGLSFVTADHFTIVQKATEYLLQLGHRRIGYISYNFALEVSRHSLQGYQAAMERALPPGEVPPPCLIIEKIDEAGFRQQLAEYLEKERPTAIVLGGSIFTAPFDKAANQLKLRIPEELSVVACSEEINLALSSRDYTTYIEPAEEVTMQTLEAIRTLSQTANPPPVTKIIGPRFRKGSTAIPFTGL